MEIVNDFLVTSEVFCSPDTTLKAVAKLMRKNNRGKIPVIFNKDGYKQILGIISTKDLCFRSLGRGLNPVELTVEDCMTSPVIVVKNNMLIHDCYKLMKEKNFESLPVIDQNGAFCGEITCKDIDNFFSRKTGAFIHQLSDSPRQLQLQ